MNIFFKLFWNETNLKWYLLKVLLFGPSPHILVFFVYGLTQQTVTIIFGYNYFKLASQLTVFYQVQCKLLYIENDAEIFPAHHTWKVAEKGFKMAFMMN